MVTSHSVESGRTLSLWIESSLRKTIPAMNMFYVYILVLKIEDQSSIDLAT